MTMKMTMAEFVGLEPCPFCGGEASVKVLEYDDDCKVWGVFCESDLADEYSHGHFVDNYATEAEAIAAWNSRVKPPCDGGYCPLCGAIERTCKIIEWYEARDRHEIGNNRVRFSCGHFGTCHYKFCAECGAKVVGE